MIGAGGVVGVAVGEVVAALDAVALALVVGALVGDVETVTVEPEHAASYRLSMSAAKMARTCGKRDAWRGDGWRMMIRSFGASLYIDWRRTPRWYGNTTSRRQFAGGDPVDLSVP